MTTYNVTEPVVATSGLTPAIPATKKYVLVKLNTELKTRALMDEAALISDSPVMIWQMSPSAVQWTSGNRGESPGMVMFCARTSNSSIPHQTAPSGSNMSMMNTLGAMVVAETMLAAASSSPENWNDRMVSDRYGVPGLSTL